MPEIPPARLALAQKRLVSILRAHTIATARTLEQKIADAGPFDQRIDPHVLTVAQRLLISRGIIKLKRPGRGNWYYLADTPPEEVEKRFEEQKPIHDRVCDGRFTVRCGQTLEIAVCKALRTQQELTFFGDFRDLDDHDDSTLYSKIEPPERVSGQRVAGGIFDFLLVSSEAGLGGIEAKNIREWLYPDRPEVTDLLEKCCSINAVPILIARRIPFVTFRLLSPCGVVFHETYNQLFPSADADLARQAAHKHLLGYHDIRIGNQPDARLVKFITTNLSRALINARPRFDAAKDLLVDYGSGDMSYEAFASNVKQRFG